MYICTAQQARNEDKRASELFHIPSLLLMEHAAQECVNVLYPSIKDKDVCILVGPGNNGGDGLAMARLLIQKGMRPSIYMPSLSMSETEKIQYDILEALDIPLEEMDSSCMNRADVIIDTLFGNGLSRNIEGSWEELIEQVNESNAEIISIDIPSGLDATSGEILGIAVQADQTLALDCYKVGHLIKDGPKTCGKLQCLDIGIPHRNLNAPEMLNLENLQIPDRSDYSHKGSFGKALMIGGSQSMHGAITMAAKAAYLSGIGTLTLMIPNCISDIIAGKLDFAMRLIAEDKNGYFSKEALSTLEDNLENYDILSIGNGMGRKKRLSSFIKTCLASNKAVCLDADSFWAIQDDVELLSRSAPTILTPHLKEFSTLMNKDLKEVIDNPFDAAKEFSQDYPNCTLILKSSMTIISKGNKMYVLNEPNSALAKGGSGDILCGILVGIYGQCKSDLEAAITACIIHSLAAKADIDPASYLPEDVLQTIPKIFKAYRK